MGSEETCSTYYQANRQANQINENYYQSSNLVQEDQQRAKCQKERVIPSSQPQITSQSNSGIERNVSQSSGSSWMDESAASSILHNSTDVQSNRSSWGISPYHRYYNEGHYNTNTLDQNTVTNAQNLTTASCQTKRTLYQG